MKPLAFVALPLFALLLAAQAAFAEAPKPKLPKAGRVKIDVVKDENGEPAQAVLNLVGRYIRHEIVVADDGHFDLPLAPGSYIALITSNGRSPDLTRLDVSSGGEQSLVKRMKHNAKPDGFLIGSFLVNGDPAPLAEVHVEKGDKLFKRARLMTDVGFFGLALPGGDYHVVYSSQGQVLFRQNLMVPAQVAEVQRAFFSVDQDLTEGASVDTVEAIPFARGKFKAPEWSEAAMHELLAPFIEGSKECMSIEAHVFGKGDEVRARKLSAARATWVRHKLIDFGAPPARLRAVGHGKARPLLPAEHTHASKINNRIDYILYDCAAPPALPDDVIAIGNP